MPKGVYLHKSNRKITWGSNISKSLTGRKLSDDHKLALSMSHKGQVNINKGVTGIFKHTEDALQKIKYSSTGRKYPGRRVHY